MNQRRKPGVAKPLISAPRLEEASSSILESVSDPLVTELLTPTTRECRKALLLASVACFAVTWGGLPLSDLKLPYVEITKTEQTNLLFLLAAVVLYFLLTFLTYAFTDSKSRKLRLALGVGKASEAFQGAQAILKEWPKGAEALNTEFFESAEFRAAATVSDRAKLAKEVTRASDYKRLVDVYLPAIVGVGAVAVVVSEAGGLPSLNVVIALAAIGLAVGIGLLLQSRRFKSRLFGWRWKVALRLMKAGTTLMGLSRLTGPLGGILIRSGRMLFGGLGRTKQESKSEGAGEPPAT